MKWLLWLKRVPVTTPVMEDRSQQEHERQQITARVRELHRRLESLDLEARSLDLHRKVAQ